MSPTTPTHDLSPALLRRMVAAHMPVDAARLRRETTAPVAEIVAYDDTRALIERSYMLMERLPGRGAALPGAVLAPGHVPGRGAVVTCRQWAAVVY